jgi:uncharacterized LabA/DUF88 family protein
MNKLVDRAVFFVDGNNWYHGCIGLGLGDLGRLNYPRVCQKLAGPRQWVSTRYYIGRVPQIGNVQLASDQQRFLAAIQSQDSRISVHLGRLEPRHVTNEAALEMKRYLANLKVRIDSSVFRDLIRLADEHVQTTVMVEKAVDVQIAIDMVILAEHDLYDTAYLLSADGDLTPAVEAVREKGKKVFVASPSSGARLAAACNTFIRLPKAWFDGLFG